MHDQGVVMNRKLVRILAALLALISTRSFAEDLATYVGNCKTQLGLPQSAQFPTMNCLNGVLFALPDPNNGNGDPTNDWVVHTRVNESVDMVAACRWLSPTPPPPPNVQRAISLEMQIHNRDNGATCFFQARNDQAIPQGQNPNFTINPQIVPPTAANAGSYWLQPADIDQSGTGGTRCAGCHVAGPYIASARIVDALGKFGLLNNGHDTYYDTTGTSSKRYHVVNAGVPGSAFEHWETDLTQPFAVKNDCSAACHILGTNSTFSDVTAFIFTLIPSYQSDFQKVMAANLMAPDDDFSPYHWINNDNPFKAGDPGDSEKFGVAKATYPRLLRDCQSPSKIEAHVVNSDLWFSTPNSFPNKLQYFNLRDGLKCNNADQGGGTCGDYTTAYLCPNGWVSGPAHAVTSAGDDESRSRATGICANPTAIRATLPSGHGATTEYGPNDRLAKFDPDGLECRNGDQGSGQSCSNYVVRYSSCSTVPEDFNLVSSWSGRDLTATNTNNDAETRAQPDNQTWSSQDWAVEYIQPTAAAFSSNIPRVQTFVRLRNVWSGRYLNVQNQGENAKVTTYDLHEDWTSEMWLAEPVAGSNDVRFRNVWSGRYLTVVDNGDFAQVLAQTLSSQNWASQRWSINRSFLVGQR
jgi:hypothetical protein